MDGRAGGFPNRPQGPPPSRRSAHTPAVGPWDWKPTPTGKIIVDFLNGKMPGYVETGLNFIAVEDCATGHLLVSEKGKFGERYLLGAENLTLKQVLDSLAQLTGLPAP